jgi:predicted dehydrogenase
MSDTQTHSNPSSQLPTLRLGMIGGGLMGREAASAFARWFVLKDRPVNLELTAVCDLNPDLLDWFRQVPTVKLLTQNSDELLNSNQVDVVYIAVPHNLHEKLYIQALECGKDLLAEKPFGIDLAAAKNIAAAIERTGRFVRCSSEFPFFPGAQRLIEATQRGSFGQILEIRAGFLHSSDLDRTKSINWKRQVKTCGEIGVMGDLGMHVVHVPFRLGWKPKRVYAQLQKAVPQRPDGKGGMAECDTWDNARLHCEVDIDGFEVPMTLETKRIAPGETNTWYLEVYGMDGSARFSTKEPKTFWTFEKSGDQFWKKTDLGYQTAFPTITGPIFEFGFPDCFLQMWAAYAAERAGKLNNRFGCVTPAEAVASHELFAAALESQRTRTSVAL